jgi:hypothetical protein
MDVMRRVAVEVIVMLSGLVEIGNVLWLVELLLIKPLLWWSNKAYLCRFDWDFFVLDKWSSQVATL